MTEQVDPSGKELMILLEALTTISYQKGGDGIAAAIADYALDKYGRAIRDAKVSTRQPSEYGAPEGIMERETELQGGHHPEQRNHPSRRRSDKVNVSGGSLSRQCERRLNTDRRVSPDRRCKPSMTVE